MATDASPSPPATSNAQAQAGRKRRPGWGVILILAGLLPLMALLPGVDYRWTLYLKNHQIHGISEFVARSLFSGEGFGATDPAMIILIICFGAYIRCFYGRPVPLTRLRPQLGFTVVSAMFSGLVLVHTVKLAVGRARPREVIKYGMQYSPWYRFGSHHLSEGFFSGSFPSGHTVSVAILLSLAYLIGGNPQASRKRRVWAWGWGAFSLCYAGFVGLGRSMSGAHWLSDCLASTGLAWFGIHCLYFYVLRIPQQEYFMDRRGTAPPLPRFWEFKFAGNVIVTSAMVMLTVVGARALVLGTAHWMGIFLLTGPMLAWRFGKQTSQVYSHLTKALT
jgi:membrane-associated phospholipid phosphatase